ncbi:magnesium transporter MgtE [Sporomusa sp.]|uniref:MotE family protein n=1 Tax=Sporomusa sp. TaxID=2078658 RepID=UPI002C10BE0F|nr:magnesium transporter MgtE [Sporomusa sp.]HWR43165.1 magnesium transporter MgtE [Sporomusa sp.]
MAEKQKNPAANSKQSPQPNSGVGLKIMAIIVALLILVGIGFAAGVYLKLIDVEKLASDMNLAKYPVIGRFFPKTNFETVELAEEGAPVQTVVPVKPNQAQQPTATLLVPQPSNPNIITREDLEKQAKLKQQEEAKRISKLSRLYGGMKPDEAIAIMKELDDPTVIAIFSKMEEEQVSKILALFDSRRAARLTQDMLKGQAQSPNL